MSDASSPKVFISYSWSTPEHEEWVLQLAIDLTESGITPVLDKWDLRPGEDAGLFMERMVNDDTISKVIMVCDRVYKAKADTRRGGAGTEAQILSAELYRSSKNSKFCAVLAELVDGKPPIPTYYAARIFIDLSDDTQRSEKFEQLVRWIFGKPLLTRPTIGPRPSYLNDDASGISLGTATRARRALDAIKTHKPFWKSACKEYFELMATKIEGLRLKSSEQYATDFKENIDAFIPYRDEIIEVVKAMAAQDLGADSYQIVHRFFESILAYTVPPEGVNQWTPSEYDNFGFIIYELFMLIIASLIRHENFGFAGELLQEKYILSPRFMTNEPAASFEIFHGLGSSTLDFLNKQESQRKISYRAFIISNRLSNSGVTPNDLAQADLVLAIRARVAGEFWWPDHLIYADRHRTMMLFARCASKKYFDRVKAMLGTELDSLKLLAKQIDDEGGFFRGIAYFSPKMSALLGEDKLCSTP